MNAPSRARRLPGPRATRYFLAWTLLLLAATAGCGSAGSFTWVTNLPPAELDARGQPIQAADRLFVFVKDQATLSAEYEVREDGSLSLPLVGAVQVAGLTPQRAASQIAERLRGIVQKPEVTVSVAIRRAPTVGVIGEVRAPGVFEARPSAQVLPTLARAGGLTEFASEDGIYVVRRGPPIQRIRFRYRDLVSGDVYSNSFRLTDGDVIVVE